MFMSTGGSAHRRFKDGVPGSPEPDPTGATVRARRPVYHEHPQAVGPFIGHRRGDDFHPDKPAEEKLL